MSSRTDPTAYSSRRSVRRAGPASGHAAYLTPRPCRKRQSGDPALPRLFASALICIVLVACTSAAETPSFSSNSATDGQGSTAEPPSAESFAPFGTVAITPDWELEGAGTNIDSIAFWEAPNPEESLMLVTAKGNQLVEVWRHPFGENDELDSLRTPHSRRTARSMESSSTSRPIGCMSP